MFRFSRSAGLLAPSTLAALICCLSLGCGGTGHRVSGKVTFQGQPVPAGKIYFTPDSSKGNSGPAGYAEIRNGEYDTSSSGGRGVTGGPVIVSIEGFDPSAKPEKADKEDKAGDVTAKQLFPKYEVAVELPKGSATKDFDVPASAANPPKKDTKFIDP
jgi:hypothetical protein